MLWGLGAATSMQEAAGSSARAVAHPDPDPDRHAGYGAMLAKYREAVDVLAPI